MRAGLRNLITDVPGVRVGNAENHHVKTGCSVVLADQSFTAAVSVMGGSPGTRETDLLAPDKVVQQVDALVLSGGSVYGLDAVGGVVDGLRQMGRGFAVHDLHVPIVPGAILFDLINGGDKNWDQNPYPALGRAALANADVDFQIGSAGAGFGATSYQLKGGLGSASAVMDTGVTVGALVGVNPLGSTIVGETGQFWAAPWELDGEFGGRGVAQAFPATHEPQPGKKFREATTIAIIATDAKLTQAQCLRVATAAQDGMARAIVPSHTPFDGDLVFVMSTGQRELADPMNDIYTLGHVAATVLARAIARGVYAAKPFPNDRQPTWASLYG